MLLHPLSLYLRLLSIFLLFFLKPLVLHLHLHPLIRILLHLYLNPQLIYPILLKIHPTLMKYQTTYQTYQTMYQKTQ